jgi:ribosome-binding protein aMBF1 (putative translation factor)
VKHDCKYYKNSAKKWEALAKKMIEEVIKASFSSAFSTETSKAMVEIAESYAETIREAI